jgi:hypothetical protein
VESGSGKPGDGAPREAVRLTLDKTMLQEVL